MIKFLLIILSNLPNSMRIPISKKIVDIIIKKYPNIHINGLEKLKGVKFPVIFISNHLSNSDGLILNHVLKDYDVTFIAGEKLAKDLYTHIGLDALKTISIKPNSVQKESISQTVQTIKNGNNILIFPEGTRSRTSKMIEGKKGILLIARLTKVPVIPIGICGTEKLMPINKSGNMSKEYFNHADVHIKFGDPFYVDKNTDIEFVMKKISSLIPKEYRGFYE